MRRISDGRYIVGVCAVIGVCAIGLSVHIILDSPGSAPFFALSLVCLLTIATAFYIAQSRAQRRADRIASLVETAAELVTSEDHFRSAIGAFHDAMILRDTTGAVKEANSSVERILGFKVEELLGIAPPTSEWSLINEDRSDYNLANLPDLVAMRTGQAQPDGSLGIERVDGTVTWLSVSAAPLFHDDVREPYGAVTTFRDVTERKAAAEANARLAAIVDSSQDGIFGTTLDGVIVNWNPGAERLFGYGRSEVIGCAYNILNPHEGLAAFRSMIKGLVNEKTTESQECVHYRKDGSPVQVSMTYSVIHNSADEPVGVAAIARDVTERKHYETQIETQMQQINEINSALQLQKEQLEVANRQLAALAMLDGLTGLKNHRAFQDRLHEELQRALRYNTPLSVFLLDVDQFKAYNDSFGHPAGDEVLRSVAHVLTDNCRASDFIARYGGEEFIVILPQTSSRGASIIAERCRKMIEEHTWTLRPITASFGVATVNVEMNSTADLISWADQALYRSKADGKNRISYANEMRLQDSDAILR